MKTIKYFLVLTVAVLGFSFVNANAQSYSSNSSTKTIEQKVFKKIIGLPYYGLFDHIAFKVEGDTVTLYGKVLSLGTKSSAESAVRKVEGVSTVINNIENLPLSQFDDQIRRQIVREYANSAGLYGYLQEPNPSVRIIVDSGQVTLEGYVNNRSTANLMNILANGVPGVFSVKNNLLLGKEPR